MCGTGLPGGSGLFFVATVRAWILSAQSLRTRGMRFSGVVIS
jgi:hypothetical protein